MSHPSPQNERVIIPPKRSHDQHSQGGLLLQGVSGGSFDVAHLCLLECLGRIPPSIRTPGCMCVRSTTVATYSFVCTIPPPRAEDQILSLHFTSTQKTGFCHCTSLPRRSGKPVGPGLNATTTKPLPVVSMLGWAVPLLYSNSERS